jgi:TetR/AcrR family transcriptional repressor of nem operon
LAYSKNTRTFADRSVGKTHFYKFSFKKLNKIGKMPVQKIEKADFLLRCWEVFNRKGYHNTSMQDLAKATGLQKAGLYHHYPTKQLLMDSVLDFAMQHFRSYVLAVAKDTSLPVEQRFEKMLRRQRRLAMLQRQGCFFANIALETGRDEIFNKMLLLAMEEWTVSLSSLYADRFEETDAVMEARRVIMEYEGAVVFYKISGNPQYLEDFVTRATKAFRAVPSIQHIHHHTSIGI